MKYKARLVAEFEVEAENVIQAREVAAALRVTGGERFGHKCSSKDRDGISYSIRVLYQVVKVEGSIPPEDGSQWNPLS